MRPDRASTTKSTFGGAPSGSVCAEAASGAASAAASVRARTNRPQPSRGGPAIATGGPGPVSLSLRAGELAVAWHDVADTRYGTTFDSTIYEDTLPTTPRGPATQTAYDAETAPPTAPGFLDFTVLTSHGLFYGRSDGAPISPADDAFELLAPGAQTAAIAAAPHVLFGATSDGATTYALYGPFTGSLACAPPGCALVAKPGAL